MEIYSIGFTQKSAAEFFGLLNRAGIKRLIDVRLNNVSQLAGFTKRDDLAFFVGKLCGADYVHEPLLAPTQIMLDAYKKATQIDPNYVKAFNSLGALLCDDLKDPGGAIACFRKAIELRPTQTYIHNGLGLVLLSHGDKDGALAEMQRESNDGWRLQGLAIVRYAQGNRAESDKALAALIQAHEKDSPYLVATVYAYRGESNPAFTWLERAYAERDKTDDRESDN